MNKAVRNVANLFGPTNEPYSIIILAAGMGLRMKSYGPKCLLNVGKRTILQRQLEIIHSNFPHYQINMVLGFEHMKVTKHIPQYVQYVVSDDFETTNVVGSLAYALQNVAHNKVLLIYGDLVFTPNILHLPLHDESVLVIDGNDSMKSDEIGCIIEDHKVHNLMYGLPKKWAQIAYLTGKELDLAKHIVQDEKTKRWFGFELFNKIIDMGGSFRAVAPKNASVVDVDSSKDLILAEAICKR